MNISTTPALLEKAQLVHEKIAPFMSQQRIPLAELIHQGHFLDAVWCCIMRAVLPENLSEMNQLGEMFKGKCVLDLTAIAEDSSLLYASPYAKRTIELAKSEPFHAIPYAIAVRGAAAREIVQNSEEYKKRYDRALGLYCHFAARAVAMRNALHDANPWNLSETQKKQLGIAGGCDKLAKIAQRRLVNPLIAEAVATREEAMHIAELDYSSFMLQIPSN